MLRWMLGLAFVTGLAVPTAKCPARSVSLVTSTPVPHPVTLPLVARSPAAWRQGVGGWGESLVESSLRQQGFEVIEIKSRGNNGIDRVALKRNAAGDLIDIRFVEVKTHYNGEVRLSATKSGRQMSREWLSGHLKAMRNSPDPTTRRLALEISRFRKVQRVPIESLGELVEVNLREGKISRRNPITGVKLSSESVALHLRQIAIKAQSPINRLWASQHLRDLKLIQNTSIKTFLSARGTSQLLITKQARFLSTAAKQAAAGRIAKCLMRAAGPIGLALVVATDGREAYRQLADYRAGRINRRQLTRGIANLGGGTGGAMAGAWGGAAFGAWLGAFGGPVAWVTVPGGTLVGGVVGGIGGYLAGSASADYFTGAWYQNLDDRVKSQVDRWLRTASVPEVILISQ